MADARYDVILSGRLAAGVDRDQARRQLAERFRLDPSRLERLMNGRRVRVKRGVDAATAERFVSAFAAAGVLAERVSHQPPPDPPEDGPRAGALEPAPQAAPKPPADPPPAPAPVQASAARDGAGGPLSLLPAGTPMGEQADEGPLPFPDTSGLSLVTDDDWTLEDCQPPQAALPRLDLTRFSLVPLDPLESQPGA